MIDLGMRLGTLLLLVGLCLPAAAGEEEPEIRGRIALSDGTEVEGVIRTTRGKPLRLFDLTLARRLDFRLADLRRIRIHVEREEQYRVWRWVEDGSREKVETGEEVPIREYVTELVLRNGQVHRGHLTGVLYVYPDGKKKPRKFILRQKQRGEKGQKLTDLVYVESVTFAGPAAEEPGGAAAIRLVVKPFDLLVTAHALPRGRDHSVEGLASKGRGDLLFPALPPDVYDLTVVTEERIYVGLKVGKTGGKPLGAKALREIRERVAEIPDFFETREVLAAVREGERVRALVRKERKGATSMGGSRVFRRWEIWSLHRGGDRWLVDHRAYLFREHGEDLPPPREAVLEETLTGKAVGAGIARVEFEIPREEAK